MNNRVNPYDLRRRVFGRVDDVRNSRVDDVRNSRVNDVAASVEQRPRPQLENERLRRTCQDLENRNAELQTELEKFKSQSHKVFEAYKTVRDAKVHLAEESTRKDVEIHQLQQEIIQYKSLVSSSSLLDKQLSDTTIQDKINALFFAVRDWALSVVLKGNVVLDSRKLDDVFLWAQVPGFHEQTRTQNVHALIAMFSGVLIDFFNGEFLFGMSSNDSFESAMRLHKSFEGIPQAARDKKKQWALLTNDILSKDVEATKKVSEETLDSFVDEFETILSRLCVNTIEPGILRRLKSAIKAHMPIIHSLHLQEADYYLELPVAIDNHNKLQAFRAAEMEDVNGGDAGMLESSFFPLVYKENLQDPDDCIIVCKAKVAVIAP